MDLACAVFAWMCIYLCGLMLIILTFYIFSMFREEWKKR